ncbi:hypothetical protein HK107_06040 [Parvularcula sp. ZS-1/3]|uniref:Uncharacterized protein n=1 Tax=Parvularcula mediterranea TaxID=2732508 RepID=A0A7Y3RLR6_9PROT|nr:hypothetical protein [Parvularcula mediterranea]NNU15881.1 hypothetical protein [Parvularcula mediterranea]
MPAKRYPFYAILALVALTPCVLTVYFLTDGQRGSIEGLIIAAVAIIVPAISAVLTGKNRSRGE